MATSKRQVPISGAAAYGRSQNQSVKPVLTRQGPARQVRTGSGKLCRRLSPTPTREVRPSFRRGASTTKRSANSSSGRRQSTHGRKALARELALQAQRKRALT